MAQEPWMDATKARQSLADAEQTRTTRTPLTDEELQLIATSPDLRDDAAVMNKLTSDERRRVRKYQRGPDWRYAPAFGGTVGGVAGGLVAGPPGAMLGAGLGGAAGRAAQMYLEPDAENTPPNIGDAGLQMTVEGAKQAAFEVPGVILGALAGPTSRRFMQSALKPNDDTVRAGRTLGIRDKGDVADFVLNTSSRDVTGTRGLPIGPDRMSAEKVHDAIEDINQSVQEVLNRAAAGPGGSRVSLTRAGAPINEVAHRAALQANPEKDLAAVNKVYDEFLSHPLAKAGSVDVAEANRIKTGTYRKVRDAYGELGSAEVEALKGLGRGLKEEVAAQVPEIVAKNLQESKLLYLEDVLRSALNRGSNRDPIGFANAAPTTKRFWLALADRSNVVKAALARAIKHGAPVVGTGANTALRFGFSAPDGDPQDER